MQNLCPIAITCDCADGNPLAGNSSEAPDVTTFVGVAFVSVLPPLGTDWVSFACNIVYESTISQADADLKAEALAQQCATAGWLNPANGNTPENFPPVPPPQGPHGGGPFPGSFNTEQLGTADCDDGSEFIYTVPAGLFWGLSGDIANAAALSYGNNQAELLKTCLSEISSPTCADEPYSATIAASGMDATEGANNWELVSGMLPPGVTFAGSGVTAMLSGTPTAIGTYTFIISVTGMDGGYVQKFYTLVVAGITNADAITDGQLNQPYSFQLAATGFTGPFFSILDGTLPAGLTMDGTGLITGTPTVATSQTITFEVQEADTGFSCEAQGTINVTGGCGAVPAVTESLVQSAFSSGGAAAALVPGATPQLFLPSASVGEPAYLWNLNTFASQTTTTDGTFDCTFAAYATSTGKLWTWGNQNILAEFSVSPFAQTGRTIQLTPPGQTSANGLSYNPVNGLLYAVTVNSIFTVNPTTAAQVGEYDLTNSNDGLQNTAAFNPSNGQVFVGGNISEDFPNSGRLLVFDSSPTPTLLHSWPLPQSSSGTIPLSCQFCPVNGYVYVYNVDQNTDNEVVTVLDPNTGTVIENIVLTNPNPGFGLYTGSVPVFNAASNLMMAPTEFGGAVVCTLTNAFLGYTAAGQNFHQGVYVPTLKASAFVDAGQSPSVAQILVS